MFPYRYRDRVKSGTDLLFLKSFSQIILLYFRLFVRFSNGVEVRPNDTITTGLVILILIMFLQDKSFYKLEMFRINVL